MQRAEPTLRCSESGGAKQVHRGWAGPVSPACLCQAVHLARHGHGTCTPQGLRVGSHLPQFFPNPPSRGRAPSADVLDSLVLAVPSPTPHPQPTQLEPMKEASSLLFSWGLCPLWGNFLQLRPLPPPSPGVHREILRRLPQHPADPRCEAWHPRSSPGLTGGGWWLETQNLKRPRQTLVQEGPGASVACWAGVVAGRDPVKARKLEPSSSTSFCVHLFES